MARSASFGCVTAAAVLLLVLGCGLVADAAKVVPKQAPAATTKGALPFRELVFPEQKPKYRSVPYFPGATFISTDCTPHGGERKISVSGAKIVLTNGGALVGGFTKVEYDFKTATLRVARSSSPASALTASLYLNYLIDEESPADVVAFAASGRKTAIALLDLLRGSLTPFAAPNQLDQCAVMGMAKRVPVYSPKVAQLVAYLKEVSDILASA